MSASSSSEVLLASVFNKRRRNIKRCADHEPVCQRISFGSLDPWSVSDFNVATGEFSDTAISPDKRFMYNSELALNTEMFAAPGVNPSDTNPYQSRYRLRDFGPTFTGVSPGVPGPFDYTKGFEFWGGDEKFAVGKGNYAAILGHFGHTHIITIYSKVGVKRENPKAKTKSQDMMLDHLLNGSTQIFKWFGQLVDNAGNAVPYDPSTPVGALKGLMDMLITGAGTMNNDGMIDPMMIIGAFQNFKNIFAPQSAELQRQIDQMSVFIDYILVNGKVHFMAWFQMMKMHQDMVYETYVAYRKLYETCSNDHTKCCCRNCQSEKRDMTVYECRKEMAQMMFEEMIDGGHQMAAFFGVFYAAVVFLDTMLDVLGDTSTPAILPAWRQERLELIQNNNIRYWREHVSIFDDFNKASALSSIEKLEKQIFRIQLTHLESCATIGLSVGEIFASFDALVRDRMLYSKLPPAFPMASPTPPTDGTQPGHGGHAGHTGHARRR